MQNRLAIFLTVVVALVLLVALNAVSYVPIEREADREVSPDRSSLNAGASGTRAFYDFLKESNFNVTRWNESTQNLLKHGAKETPVTFVVVGNLRVPFKTDDEKILATWVRNGGRLVFINRETEDLLPKNNNWEIKGSMFEVPNGDVFASNVETLTKGVKEFEPQQPTLLTRDVSKIAPSRYAGRLQISFVSEGERKFKDDLKKVTSKPNSTSTRLIAVPQDEPPPRDIIVKSKTEPSRSPTRAKQVVDHALPPAPPPSPLQRSIRKLFGTDDEPPPRIVTANEKSSAPLPNAPVVQFADERGAMLIDYGYGNGRVIILTDPFIVANNGINRADNLQLAINLVASGSKDGLIAFDEYHQGRMEARNALAAYFAGTPVLWLVAQLAIIALAIVWSRGRRFARALPAPRVDRRSSLEFVASMAELQMRARANDLAIENIYNRTRRALARYAGVKTDAPRTEIAERAAKRAGLDAARLESLMRECEDAMHGTPLSSRRAVELAAELRELESKLGLRLRSREVKQIAARNAL